MWIKMITSLLFIGVISGYIYLQKLQIEKQNKQISTLKAELKECNSTNDAKEFEIKWSNEFLNQFKDTGVEEDEKNNNANSSAVFNDSF